MKFTIFLLISFLLIGIDHAAYAEGTASPVAPAAGVVAAAPGATAETFSGGPEACITRIECDPWVLEMHKELLSKLLVNFVSLGAGRTGNVPGQLEIIATLAARAISVNR